jgi:alpha-1,4-fucosyltransferase
VELSKSKFVLVFENTKGIEDYVSEKLSHALLAGAVPVVWGASNVADSLPDPRAGIIVSGTDLERNPARLAKMLLDYDNDDEAYRRDFFQWKSRPLTAQFQSVVDLCYLHAGCRICEWVKRQCQQ